MGYVRFRCQEKTDPGSPGRIAGKPGPAACHVQRRKSGLEMCDSFKTCIANRVVLRRGGWAWAALPKNGDVITPT
jgi:hypothetical protein